MATPYITIGCPTTGGGIGQQIKIRPLWEVVLSSCQNQILQLVDVELELGYTAVISDTVGSVHPMPPIKKYKFSLNSAARKV